MAGVQPEASQIVGRSVDGWTSRLPDLVGDGPRPPTDDRGGHERFAPPGRSRLPGAAHRPRALRLRQRHEMAVGDRVDDAGGVRRLLGPPRLGEGGTDPHAVPHRCASLRRTHPRRAGGDRGCRLGARPGRFRGRGQHRRRPWPAATISEPLSDSTWVQWMLLWDALQGDHRISVRATDGDGVVQTDESTPPAPDGARGHHTITVGIT